MSRPVRIPSQKFEFCDRAAPSRWNAVISAVLAGIAAFLIALGSPAPLHAGPLEDAVGRIENKVDNIKTKTNNIFDETSGLQDLTITVNAARNDFRPQVLAELQAHLSDAQDLFEYLKAETDAVGPSGNYTDVIALLNGVESLLNSALAGSGGGVDLSAIRNLLQFLPDQVLAATGQAVQKAGVDSTFVNDLNQMALDVAVLNDAGTLEPEDPQSFLAAGTSCSWLNTDNHRSLVQGAAHYLTQAGVRLKAVGSILQAVKKTAITEEKLAVWGLGGGLDPDESGGWNGQTS
jgi:hypothetical protein